ncbi:hypothetical protein ACS0TY_017749 [Phlomoides rotata]
MRTLKTTRLSSKGRGGWTKTRIGQFKKMDDENNHSKMKSSYTLESYFNKKRNDTSGSESFTAFDWTTKSLSGDHCCSN